MRTAMLTLSPRGQERGVVVINAQSMIQITNQVWREVRYYTKYAQVLSVNFQFFVLL